MNSLNAAAVRAGIPLVWALVPLMASAGTITGTVTFWGDSGGSHPIEIAAHVDPTGPPVAAVEVAAPGGDYQLTVNDGSFWISAYLDRDESGGEPGPDEPLVWYDANGDGRRDPVTVTGSATVENVDIDLGFVYVDIDASGAGDGTSWADAFTDLNGAIGAAASGIEVWVAEGSYTPGDTRSAHFALKNGVRVFGGFDGTERNRTWRDPHGHPTVLSGEIGEPGAADNVYNVVWANGTLETAVLDGFTVTGGRADGAVPYDKGGGLYAYFGVATVVGVTFLDNYAKTAGGGVASQGGVVHIYNSRFFGNRAGAYPAGLGGGFYGTTNGEKLVNCVFSGNQAGLRGGGVYMGSGSFGGTLASLSIAGNTAGYEGGGLFIDNNGATQSHLTNSIVWGNSPQQIINWGAVNADYNLVQGGLAGGGNISTADPLFFDANGDDDVIGTEDDDLWPQPGSPAIDAGSNALVPADAIDLDGDLDRGEPIPFDLAFSDRFTDLPGVSDTGSGTPPIVDLGAFEIELDELIFEDGFE